MSKVSVSLEAYNELNKILDDYYNLMPYSFAGAYKLRAIQGIYNEEVKLEAISPEEAVKAICLGFEVMSREEQFLNKIEKELEELITERESFLNGNPVNNKRLRTIDDRLDTYKYILKIWKEIYAPNSKVFTE
ncbi:hypothetical protein 056SW001B_68 [Bacillus phage 056SW001B]|uniref:Uncharacterized protein n=1 Tax=Bacillus phage 056SW001B TaxID=2601663 RepID=A0A5P8PIG8_9CAUD|nr:hypothetical protein 056SW001B_68 [Bacillus phage 056SW001B]